MCLGYNLITHLSEFLRKYELPKIGKKFSVIRKFIENHLKIFLTHTKKCSLEGKMKNKRSKLQIYYDIISAIQSDMQSNGEVSKTRIQQKCNTSYDKLIKYIQEMEEKNLLKNNTDLEVTELGYRFFDDYSKVNNMINEITERLS